MNGGVESGLFRVSGSRRRIAADVHGDKNRESPQEARQQTDRCGWRRQLAPLRPPNFVFSGVLAVSRCQHDVSVRWSAGTSDGDEDADDSAIL